MFPLFHGRKASTIKRATTAYNTPKKTLDTKFSCQRIEFDFSLRSSIFTAVKLVTAINCISFFFSVSIICLVVSTVLPPKKNHFDERNELLPPFPLRERALVVLKKVITPDRCLP